MVGEQSPANPQFEDWREDLAKLLPKLRNYIADNLGLKQMDVSEIVRAEIVYTGLRSGKEIRLSPSQFKQRIKINYTESTDFERFHPESFDSNKDDLLEGSYQSFRNKLQ